jgi:hypothetical protein
MAYPFKEKEISRTKNVKILVNTDVTGNLPEFDKSGNKSSVVKVAVPKGEYISEKVNFEKFSLDDKSTGQKWTQYFVNIPMQTSYGVSTLSPFPIYSNYVTEITPSPTTPNITQGTPTTTPKSYKNIIMGVLAIGLIIGLLKWKKVI